ncbi:MotA/TolQ/ExbB proton channel family protein [Mucilaginibacter sp.]|uniref:MotA/TolQ/ExbB proton channel family protein n=1 Tax=Mucilaginibacter sp. TaxID=1882438 RepID=UPI003B008215
MDLLKILESLLYTLSNLVIYPVLVTLLFLLGKVIYGSGVFCREYWLRSKSPAFFIGQFINEINNMRPDDASIVEIELNHVLEKAGQKSMQQIQAARYSVKMGPTLGLIGTLTPMAKALSSLSQGNLNSLSSQMISAFSTTIIGLVVGGIAYSIMHARLKWQRKDIYELSKLAEEKLAGSLKKTYQP